MIRLALKDLKLFLKDRRSMLMTFAIPIALISLFAFAFGGVGKGNEETKISMQISDLDNTTLSKDAVNIFTTLKNVDAKVVPIESAQDAIKKGKESNVLVIHKGFADSLADGGELPLELQYDEAKEIEVGLLQQSLIPKVATIPFSLGNPKAMMASRFEKMTENSSPELKENIQHQSDNLFETLSKGIAENSTTQDPSSAFFGNEVKMTKLVAAKKDNGLGLIQAVAGTAVMMLLFSVVGIGMSLLEEKQEGTLKRLLYAPMNPLKILFGKMISANIISIIQLIVMFLFAALVFGLEINNHITGLLITIIATAFACSAFGVFLASFAKTRQQVQGLSTLIILVMSAIGGSMIPIFFMPSLMQKAAVLSVNYWSIQGFFDILWRNLSIFSTTFLSRILVLVLIGVILNTLAVFMFRRNILKMS
ncbi:MAG: ABC transporter permease [Chitinophagaceae bacterium]|nr:ABC transporter permease [Chitinophagaceae bacterium]MCZ2395525.1 ABC transporter permease [Chitinophagales bacterium]